MRTRLALALDVVEELELADPRARHAAGVLSQRAARSQPVAARRRPSHGAMVPACTKSSPRLTPRALRLPRRAQPAARRRARATSPTETAALGPVEHDADRRRAGRVPHPARAPDRRAPRRRGRHVHRLQRDLDRAWARRRRPPPLLRRERGVDGDRAPLLRACRPRRPDHAPPRPGHRHPRARCPPAPELDFAFIDADKTSYRRLLRGAAAAAPRRTASSSSTTCSGAAR